MQADNIHPYVGQVVWSDMATGISGLKKAFYFTGNCQLKIVAGASATAGQGSVSAFSRCSTDTSKRAHAAATMVKTSPNQIEASVWLRVNVVGNTDYEFEALQHSQHNDVINTRIEVSVESLEWPA